MSGSLQNYGEAILEHHVIPEQMSLDAVWLDTVAILQMFC
jgi:hypothetical protein